MAADGQVIFEIQADNKPLKATLTETTGAIEKESKNWDQSVANASDKMSGSFGGALKSMAAAVAASKIGAMLVDFGKQAIAAASDLEEVQNVVDVTFGESAAEINAWAKNAINQFGLTETQAKRFASTMGAMMKSSGIASKDITKMSEDLAGLAADMASFYNLDFDEAFNKIRSGISGETEPLKQLGINMSAANLEAYALAQGLDKAYSKMSQGEQTMLRYQYLMEATADAQGDFNRTSDGFANGVRLLQSNFETLKTTVGTLLIQAINPAIEGLNQMLGLLIPETKKTTVLDDFAQIDLQTQQKLADIESTKTKALELVGILEEIEQADIQSNIDLSGIAQGANLLSSDASSNWRSFIGSLDSVGTLITSANGGEKAGDELKGLASGGDSLTGTAVNGFKYENLPPKIQDLFKKAGLIPGINTQLGDLDKEGEKLTKESETGFKYADLPGNIDKLVDSANKSVLQNTKGDLEDLAEGGDAVSGADAGFKFSSAKDYVGDLIKNSDKGSEAGKQLKKLADGADKLVGTDNGFKYAGYGPKVKEIIDDSNGGISAGTNLKKLGEGAKQLSGADEGFKYANVKEDIGDLIKESGGIKGIVSGKNLEAVAIGADKLSGSNKGYAYQGVTDSVDDLIANAEGGANAGTELSGLATGADAISKVTYSSDKPLGKMAEDVKILDSTSVSNWRKLLNAFNNLPAYKDKLNGETIETIAGAFNGLEGDKATAWQTLMDALGSDLTALAELTGKDENEAAQWLTEMKDAANGLNSADVGSWNALLTLLANGTPGAGNYLGADEMASIAEAAGMSEDVIASLADASASAEERQSKWLETCKRLVKLIPELNEVINTETGEIKGNIQTVKDYVETWSRGQQYMTLVQAQEARRRAVTEKYNEIPGLEVDMMVAERRVREQRAKLDALKEKYGFGKDGYELIVKMTLTGGQAPLSAEEQEWNDAVRTLGELTTAADNARESLDSQKQAQEVALEVIAEGDRAIAEEYAEFDKLSKGAKDAGDSVDNFNDTQKKTAQEGVQALANALKDVNDYIDRTKKSIDDSIDSLGKGFKQLETGVQYIDRLKKEQEAAQAEELKRQQEQYNKTGELKIDVKLTGVEDTVPSLLKMQDALKSQAEFLQDYYKNFQTAKDYGLTDEFLSQFTDITQENAGYLYLIASGGKQEALKLQAAYDQMAEAKKPLVDSLAETKLKADETFNELVEKARQAALDLNNTDVAKASMEATIAGVAEGIRAKVPEVASAVDALNAELERLGQVGGESLLGSGFGIDVVLTGGGEKPDSLAIGSDYIPFDNYLTYLHEGEAVLTAEEAAIWRNFKNGGLSVANTIDYGQLSSAIWDNAPRLGGGNVYLDGQSVGRVISAQQATAVRNLERSGWMG